MTRFVRPANLKYPQIYHTFKAKDKKSDELVEYRIQDLPDEDYERALDLMMTDFVPEETLSYCRDLESDLVGMKEIREFWANELKNKVSIACYRTGNDDNNNDNDLVGFCALSVVSKDELESDLEFKSEATKDIFTALHFIESHYNVFDKHNVNHFVTDYGIVTSKNYRKRGIATEFYKARIPLLKALNLTVTTTVCTVIGSQKAAIKANYNEVFSIKWMDVGETFQGFNFAKSNAEYCKILDYKI